MAFQIKPDKKETENKTIRFPVLLIKQIEDAICNRNVSFSGFVIQACQYALEQMEEGMKEAAEKEAPAENDIRERSGA